MKRLTLILGMLLLPLVSFAQEAAPAVEEAVGSDPLNWLMYAALAINAALVPLGADVLKRVWAKMPSALKTILPLVAGSIITAAEVYLLGIFGAEIDLSLIEQVLLGGGVAGLGASVAFSRGSAHEASK